MVLSSPPSAESQRLFSDIYCGAPIQLLEVNLTVLWGPSPAMERVLRGLSHWISGLSALNLQKVFHSSSVFLTRCWFPRWSLTRVSSLLGLYSCTFVCPSSLEGRDLPCVLSSWSKQNCWFFSLFIFLLVLVTEGWLLSFHTETVAMFFFF